MFSWTKKEENRISVHYIVASALKSQKNLHLSQNRPFRLALLVVLVMIVKGVYPRLIS